MKMDYITLDDFIKNPKSERQTGENCECAALMEHLYDNGMETECRHACKVHNHMPLSGKEFKYGQNWLNHLVICPRCCEAVPVIFKVDQHGTLQMHCRKCAMLKHVEGSVIKEYDLLKFRRIIDG